MSIKLKAITINTANLQGLRDFYTGLGLQFEKAAVFRGSEVYRAVLDGIEISLFGMMDRNNAPTPPLQLSFQVQQMENVVGTIKRIPGVSVLLEPTDLPDGRKTILKDPDGNSVEIIQPI